MEYVYIVPITSSKDLLVQTFLFQSFDADSVYTHVIGPILYDVKYFFVFTGSALNPILYGYRSDTMRKAFKLTFPCFFKKKVGFEHFEDFQTTEIFSDIFRFEEQYKW